MRENAETPAALEPAAEQTARGSAAAALLPAGVLSRQALGARPGAARTLASAIGNRAMRRVLARDPLLQGFTGKDFAEAVGERPTVSGQFMFRDAILAALDAKLRALVPAGAAEPLLFGDFRAVMNDFRAEDFGKKKAALRKKLEESLEPYAPDLLKLIGPESVATRKNGEALVSRLWEAYKKPGSPMPDLSDVTTINHLKAADMWELSACWTTAERLGAKFTAAMKQKYSLQRRREKRMSAVAMASIKRANRDTDWTALTAKNRVRGDEVLYDDRLPVIVQKMKDALADGWVLHIRVVSGIYLDMAGKGTPYEEHSLLLIGYAGDEFFSFDPDAGSNTASPRAAAGLAPATNNHGFQSFFFDSTANRFSTAKTDAEFPVDYPWGRQANGQHRYQLVRVWTLGY